MVYDHHAIPFLKQVAVCLALPKNENFSFGFGEFSNFIRFLKNPYRNSLKINIYSWAAGIYLPAMHWQFSTKANNLLHLLVSIHLVTVTNLGSL